jgi:hypothetical protein
MNKYTPNGREFMNLNAKENLHYGEPVFEYQTLIFHKDFFLNINNKPQLTILFGGKLSPAKTSLYTLKMPSVSVNAYEHVIADKIENKLMVDYYGEKGYRDFELLKLFLENL